MWRSSLAITRERRMISGRVPTIVITFIFVGTSYLVDDGIGTGPVKDLVRPEHDHHFIAADVGDVVRPARNGFDHLRRVSGDGPWLGASPRYALDDGALRYTGSFDSYRWSDPLAGLRHLVDQQFAFVRAIGLQQRQEREAEIFTALVVRLQTLAREKFGAPLVVVYSWPDESSGPNHDNSDVTQPMLVSTLAGLRRRGMPMISVDGLEAGYDNSRLLIPHDGHPTALADRLIAAELKRRLAGLR